MSTCRKCGEPLNFVRRPGRHGVMKLWPVNPDGSDHFDLCRQKTRRMLTPADVRILMASHPPLRTHSVHTHFWSGAEAPWDESLGKFRDFTDIEKVELEVCRS